MNLVLNVYTDDTLNEIKRTVEADRVKIPYRVTMDIIETLDNLDIKSDDDLLKFISSNIGKLDKIVKATFGVSDSELECVDSAELINMIKELYAWAISKYTSLKGKNEKN